jgi:hypothetical protein
VPLSVSLLIPACSASSPPPLIMIYSSSIVPLTLFASLSLLVTPKASKMES